jgi:hypothetical protein
MKISKSCKQTLIYAVVLTIGAVGFRIWSEKYGPRHEEALTKLATEHKNKLPIKVDADTTWVDLKYESTKSTYWYVVDSEDAIDQRVLQQIIRDEACSKPEMLRTIKEKGFSYEYHYTSKKGTPLATFTISNCP